MFPNTIKSVISIWFDEDTGFGNSPTEFMHHMQTSSVLRSEGAITLSRSVRAGLAIKNPIAFVQESKSLINLVCSLLIGAPPEHFFARSAGKSSRKTKYFQETKGVIGHALGYIGVVEDHAKGTLHYHLLIIGGLTHTCCNGSSPQGRYANKSRKYWIPYTCQKSHFLTMLLKL